MEKNKSAVDFLYEKIVQITWMRSRDEISETKSNELLFLALADAKQMFENQIIDAYRSGEFAFDPSADNYYSQTYPNGY